MTIDKAIKKQYEEAIRQESIANGAEYLGVSRGSIEYCKQCATEHRQMAEWLTDYKELREKQKSADRQIAEYKRLLKSAIDEWHIVCEWGECSERCDWFENGKCTQEWSGKAEALKLIRGSENE